VLRVLHVYKDVHPPVVGGVEKHIDGLRRTMRGVESDVLVCARAPRTSVRSVAGGTEIKVAEFGPRWLSLPIAPTFARWMRRLRADVLHVHMPNPLAEGSVLVARGQRPVVLSYHADIVRQAGLLPAYRRLVDACLERAAAVVVSSQRIAESSPLLVGHAHRVTIIPFGIDTEHFDPGRVSEATRTTIRRRYGSPLVVAVGRLVYYKGFENLIAAARRLDASVLIVGDGPWAPRLRALARGMDRVHFVGRVSEPRLVELLAAADSFVLPSTSRAESFGVATLEAQAMALPAVVTDVGTGTVDAIEPGRTGIAIPPGDPASLAEAIESLLADPERARAMGEAGRHRVVERHGLAARVGDMRALYERVA